ncbi:plasmid SOS inhibition protein A [Escherichia coli]|uniref:Plasmid SOS inhibition protein A n=1 Tax=Escherichia coli TaxID=562 RepID=A0A484VLN3_ECOLX|nr:plasmid SOS inhibition protein A [Escherichia coli]
MNARSRALVPLSTEQQAAWRAVAETEKRRHQGNTLAEYPVCGSIFPLSERKPPDFAV